MNPLSLPKGSTSVGTEPGLDFLSFLVTSGVREKSNGEINHSSTGGGGCYLERKRGTKEKEV